MEVTSDFHCVTRWSRFDNLWKGVAFREILKLARLKPEAKFVLVHAEQGYTANVPLADLDRENVLLATHHDGQPLPLDHGYPLRLIVPASVCVEVGEMGARLRVSSHGQAGLLGTERVSHLRRPVSRAEIQRGPVMRNPTGSYFFTIGL